MRDDLVELFNLIEQYQSKKINLLTDFRNKEFELKHILTGKIEDSILTILDYENLLIEKINICDYEISVNIDQVKQIGGFDPSNTRLNNYTKNEDHITGFRDRLNRIKQLLNEIEQIKRENMKTMESIAREASDSSDELDRLDKVKRRFAKDLQSF